MFLENNLLKISFSDSLPLINGYELKHANQIIMGQRDSYGLIINNNLEPWEKFDVIHVKDANLISFICKNKIHPYAIRFEFRLESFELCIKVSIDDPKLLLKHISFSNYPFISISNSRAILIREYWLRNLSKSSPYLMGSMSVILRQ